MTPPAPGSAQTPVPRHSWRSLLYVRGESKLPSAWPRIWAATLLAVVITFTEHVLHIDTYSLTAAPFTILGVAISFFLGFRNNTAYTRFWEARTLWGRLINTSRSLARQTLTQIVPRHAPDGGTRADALLIPAARQGIASVSPVPHSPQSQQLEPPQSPSQTARVLQDDIIHLLIGYAYAMRHHLHDTDPAADLQTRLPAETLTRLREQENKPLGLLILLAQKLQQAREQGLVTESDVLILERGLTELTDVQGGCERIKNTPMPLTYTLLSHRIVTFFCCALPLGLVDTVKMLTPLVVFLVSYAFFSLDVLGEEISDPFGTDPHDLPLPAYAATIEKNLHQTLNSRSEAYHPLR